MTRTFRCAACGATYADVQADGMIYFHACSPMPPDKNGVSVERPNRRDENIAMTRSGNATGIKSEGAGVTCLNDAKILQPAWISPFLTSIGRGEEDADVNSVL